MSTKLYDGLKLRDSSSDIFELVPRVAEAISEVYGRAAIELMATELVEFLDGLTDLEHRNPQDFPIYDLEDEWIKRQRELGPHHALNDPLRFSIVFGRAESGELLAYPFYREQRYRDALESLEIFEDYHYQNQSDRPEELTPAQWAQRRRDWDSVLDGQGTLSSLPSWQLSATLEPFRELHRPEARSVDANILCSPDRRLQRVLQSALFGYAAEELNPSSDRLFPLLHSCDRAVRTFLQSDEGSRILRPEPLPQGLLFGYGDFSPYEIDPELIAELFRRV